MSYIPIDIKGCWKKQPFSFVQSPEKKQSFRNWKKQGAMTNFSKMVFSELQSRRTATDCSSTLTGCFFLSKHFSLETYKQVVVSWVRVKSINDCFISFYLLFTANPSVFGMLNKIKISSQDISSTFAEAFCSFRLFEKFYLAPRFPFFCTGYPWKLTALKYMFWILIKETV